MKSERLVRVWRSAFPVGLFALIALIALFALFAPFATPAAAQDHRPAVAVFPFENSGSYGQERESFDALRKGLAAMLISELAVNPELRLVDRTEIQRTLDQQGLAAAERVDKETAIRLGRLVGAGYLVTGSFIDLYGDVRLDARLLEVETGKVLKAVHSDPPLRDRSELYRMVRSVAVRLAEGAPLMPSRQAVEPPTREVPTDALFAFSRGLLFEDRGDRSKAAQHYRDALRILPAFDEAREGLRRVGGSE
ncbi:MAG: CsgG/HfaB family protein [Gemmatimonadales bacterium]